MVWKEFFLRKCFLYILLYYLTLFFFCFSGYSVRHFPLQSPDPCPLNSRTIFHPENGPVDCPEHFICIDIEVQVDHKVSMHLIITVQKTHKNSVHSNNPHTTDDLKMAITEYIRNVDRAILNTVFENTVRCVNKCLETGGGHFEHYL
jgi:hypothetical protein